MVWTCAKKITEDTSEASEESTSYGWFLVL